MNRFATDSDEEIAVVKNGCTALGVPVALADVFALGGEGGRELAEAVLAQAKLAVAPYTPLYDWNLSIPEKIETIARRSTARARSPSPRRRRAISNRSRRSATAGCRSASPRPRTRSPTIRRSSTGRATSTSPSGDVVLSAGAGFVVPLLGEIIRMPGLPASPQAEQMDLVNGDVVLAPGGPGSASRAPA